MRGSWSGGWAARPAPRSAAATSTGTGARVDRVADVTGDGGPDLVAEYHAAGASAAHAWVYIYRWEADRFEILFQDRLSNWVGENRWSVELGTVAAQCHPFGPYEHKMLEHRQQTERYRWNAGSGGYELTQRTREPVPSRHLQVTEAEALFQLGRYDEAAEAYRKVADLPVPQQDPEFPDWAAYAHLRLGQIHALQGRETEALADLSRAESAAEPIASLALTFRQHYQGKDAAEAFQEVWR